MTTAVRAPTVADVMTRCPLSVRRDTPFRAIAALLAGSQVSAVPVVDDRGAPVGVVSEIDLIDARPRAGHGLTARALMSSPVVTVTADESVASATRRLTRTGVRRLFVVADGKLVGVLARRDLLRGYLCPDDVLAGRVEDAVAPLAAGRGEFVNVTVADGVVTLLGRVQWRSAVAPVGAAAAAVPGVVEVRNRLGCFWYDKPRRAGRTRPGDS
ncbi:CBS domain-containing protein [Actinophytocola sp. KF-1]